MSRPLDIAGRRFGRLTAIRFLESRRFHGKWKRIWMCQCDCGVATEIRIDYLTSGDTRSCGCWVKEINERGRRYKHGGANTTEFNIWCSMRQRCNSPSCHAYQDYGGRGITVCERWSKFEAFLADMGPRPKGLTLERINNDSGYSPENCRWASRTEQANNRRSNRIIAYLGESKTLAQWASVFNVSHSTMWNRLRVGMPMEGRHANLP